MSNQILLERIAAKKEEIIMLENEIKELEQRLIREPEKLKNPKACYCPNLYYFKKCRECGFYQRCIYEKKLA